MNDSDQGHREKVTGLKSEGPWTTQALSNPLLSCRHFMAKSQCTQPVTLVICPLVQRTCWVSTNHAHRRVSGVIEITKDILILDSLQIKKTLGEIHTHMQVIVLD